MNSMNSTNTTNTVFEDALAGRIDALKQFYTEFFILMDVNLEERPELDESAPAPTDLDKSISSIMDDIQKHMDELRSFLNSQVNWRKECGAETLALVDDFQLKLAAGLEAVLGRVEVRGNELQTARDEAKAELVGVVGKNKSNAAYQFRRNAPSTLFDSKA